MPPTRHQRNATASMVYTHHERKKDAKSSGYGTLEERLVKEAIKEFDCCSLTLQPCRDPVITPDGVLFDKEAILEYILHQKREIARKQKEYERQMKKGEQELEDLAKAEREDRAKKFVEAESTPAHPGSRSERSEAGSSASAISNMAGANAKNVPSFWIPSVAGAGDVKETKMEKPDTKIYCPITGRQLKMKDLVPVKFTLADEDNAAGSSKSVRGKTLRYKCAITGDILTNSTPTVVLKTSGNVVTMDCVDRIIRQDWIDPTNGAPMTESDIIPLQRGGTGFAAVNDKLKAKMARPVIEFS